MNKENLKKIWANTKSYIDNTGENVKSLLNKNVGISEYETFSEGKSYSAGTTVLKDGLLYTFITDHAAGAWDASQVEETSLKGEVDKLTKSLLCYENNDNLSEDIYFYENKIWNNGKISDTEEICYASAVIPLANFIGDKIELKQLTNSSNIANIYLFSDKLQLIKSLNKANSFTIIKSEYSNAKFLAINCTSPYTPDNFYNPISDNIEETIEISINIENSYIDYKGNKQNNNGWGISAPLKVEKGDVLKIITYGYKSNISIISKTDESLSYFHPLLISSAAAKSQMQRYYYIVNESGYITFSKSVNEILVYKLYSSGYCGLISNINKEVKSDILSVKKYIEANIYADDCYINSSGIKTSLSGYAITTPIAVQKGDYVKVVSAGYVNRVAMISYTDEESSYYEPIVISDDNGDNHTQSYFLYINKNGYIAISFQKETGVNVCKLYSTGLIGLIEAKSKEIIEVDNKLGFSDSDLLVSTYLDNKYIDKNGNISDNKGYLITNPIEVSKGDIVAIYGAGYQDNVALISKTNSASSIYQPLVLSDNPSDNSNKKAWYYYISDYNGYVAFSYEKSYGFAAYKLNSKAGLIGLINNFYNKNYNTNQNSSTRYIDLFNKVIFIGDSVTEGYIEDLKYGSAITNNVQASMSYPAKIGQLVPHLNIINKGHSGESVQGWNNNRFETEYNQIKEGVDLTILELGWNQVGDYSWPTSEEDFNNEFENNVKIYGDDYNSYVTINSCIGSYCQLVKKILNANPNVVLVLVSSMGWDDLRSDFVNQIADWANVLFMDLHNYKPDNSSGAHFTPWGYVQKANIALSTLNLLFEQNKDYVNYRIYKNNNMLTE